MRGAAQGVCSEAGSFDLTGAKLGSAIQEMLAAVEVALVKRDSEGQTHAQVNLPMICNSTLKSRLVPEGCSPIMPVADGVRCHLSVWQQ